MKNIISRLTKKMFTVMILIMMICGISYAAPKPVKINKKQLLGTWFWNFGYNQEKFSRDEITFNKDQTFEIFSINQNYTEYDKGKYSIIQDEKYGTTLVLNITNYKEKKDAAWEKCDLKIFFAINSLDNEKFTFSRYRRDFSAMGNGVYDYDPPIFNEFTKIKAGTKENLIGSWRISKIGTPDCTWDEKWTFNNNGSMECFWEENEAQSHYKGSYEVIKSKNGSVLHQILKQESSDGISFTEINPPMEFWYDLKIDNENLINVSCTKNKMDGKEQTFVSAKENFYYRDLDLVSYTYHWSNATFKDYAPKGSEYILPGLEKQYLYSNVYYDMFNQGLNDWYDNQNLTGQPVKSISAADNNTDREFWADWSLKLNKNLYDPQNGKYNHDFTLPLSVLNDHMEYPENTDLPTKGKKFIVILSGKVSRDIDIDWGLRLVDRNNNEWNEVASDWHHIKTKDKNLLDIFELEIIKDLTTDDPNLISFNIAYNPDQLDEVIKIDDFKFEILDKNNQSKIIEHTLHYGSYNFKHKSVTGYDSYFPENPYVLPYPENTKFWTMGENEFLGWYDNPDFKGKALEVLPAADNTKSKDFYGKYNLKFYKPNPDDAPNNEGRYYSNRWIPLKSVVPEAKINPKAGELVKVAISANLSADYEGSMGLDLHNLDLEDSFLGNDWHYVESKNKKLQAYFEIHIQKDGNFKSMENAALLLAYNPLSKNDQLIMSDFKIELVDKDPFVTTEAQTKHVTIKPCSEGLEITVRKLESEKGNWKGSFNFGFGEASTLPNGYIHEWAINKNEPITFIWPFCEKGKIYKFECSWTDENGIWHGENLSIIASNGKNELNYKALEKTKISVESNSQGAYISLSNFSKEVAINLLKNYSDRLENIGIETPIISGKKDWSDTNWLFAPGMTIYPESDPNNSFCNDLLSKGKANVLGDHNFWWGSKADINKALSERSTFWTDLRIHFMIKPNTNEVGFYLVPVESNESIYTPLKF